MMACVLAVMILALGLDLPGERSPGHGDVSRWLTQLGHRRFQARERATRELVGAGEMALPAVRAGTRSDDPEVVARCERLLSAIRESDRPTKLRRLLSPIGGRQPAGLPELEQFLSIAGDTRAARELYAEMLRNHHDILDSIEDNPASAPKLLEAFAQMSNERRTLAAARMPVRRELQPPANLLEHPSEVALFLFVRSDRRFDQAEDDEFELEMVQDPGLQELVTGPKASPLFQKLFVDWYRYEKSPLLLRSSNVAVRARMRALLPVMLRCLTDNAVKAPEKAWFLNAIAVLGDKTSLELVEPFLEDKTVVVTFGFQDEGGALVSYEAQLGDIALSVCWK